MLKLKILNAKLRFKVSKTRGVTLLEVLVASGIASIVIVAALSTVGSIYFTQKKIQFTQNFYAESRVLMERIAQIARNNTIDYDRFFLESGPPVAPSAADLCDDFDADQVSDVLETTNDAATRALYGYTSLFYWDTNNDGTQNRNLGGVDPNDAIDPCTQAWDPTIQQSTLFLINGSRSLRTAVRNKDDHLTIAQGGNAATEALDTTEDYRIEIQRQLGADIDNDGIIDVWGPTDTNNDGDTTDINVIDLDVNLTWDDLGSGLCEVTYYDATTSLPVKAAILGDATDEDLCRRAHDWTAMSPKPMKITNLAFNPNPNRDPFLNFRVDAAQVHPNVFINLTTDLRDPSQHGFTPTNRPNIAFQTSVTSRVFGNTRN